MANEELPKPDVPAVDIPNLKKQEKERKKAGVAWGQAGKGANAWEGAIGGSGQGGALAGRAGAAAARSAAAAARGVGQGAFEGAGFFARFFGRIAARLMGGGPVSQFFGRVAAALAQFATTTLGQLAMAGAMAMIVGGAGLAAGILFGRGGGGQNRLPDLGDIASSIRIRRNGDMSGLDMAKNNGLVSFDGAKAKAAQGGGAAAGEGKTEGASGQGEAAAGDPAAEGLDNSAIMAAQKDRLAHDMSMTKLSSSLGGGGRSFGNRDIFGSGPRLGRGFNSQIRNRPGRAAGPVSPSSRARVQTRASARRGAMNRSRALGRLMQMSTLNNGMRANTTGAETASTLGSDQFEGQGTTGGPPPSGPDGGGTSPTGGNPTGTGNPGGNFNPPAPTDPTDACLQEGMMSDGNGGCVDPTQGPAGIANPWSGMVQGVLSMIESAKQLLLVASVLYLAAIAWFATGCCAYVGAIIMAIVAVIMSIVITVLANNIKQMGEQIKNSGQQQALGDGIKDIGNDLIWGAWTAIAAGIGGVWFYGKVTAKAAELQGKIEAVSGPNDPRNINPDFEPPPEGGSGNEA